MNEPERDVDKTEARFVRVPLLFQEKIMFDALMLASYGGPEKLDDIEPFLDRVLAGKRVPPTRRAAVAERYRKMGASPLPGECRLFIDKLASVFEGMESRPRLYWGNLYAEPTFDEAFDEIERDGVRSLLVFPSSAFGSPQSCRRYIDAVQRAFQKRSESFRTNFQISNVPPFFDAREHIRGTADSILTALAWDVLDSNPFESNERTAETSKLLLFTAHSIPSSDGANSRYVEQLIAAVNATLQTMLDAPGFDNRSVANRSADENCFSMRCPMGKLSAVAEIAPSLRARLKARGLDAALAFQSRSGSPLTPWLEPNVGDLLTRYKKKVPELKSVVVVPIGFFFENMETAFDLDIEIRGLCEELEIAYRRAKCCGTSDVLIGLARRLVEKSPSDFPGCSFSCQPDSCAR